MNYKKIYDNLIYKCQKEGRVKTREIYYEKHHIIPTFMFKDNKRASIKNNFGKLDGDSESPSNLVLLTPREHFIAHVLLYKIYKGTLYEYKCGAALVLFFNTANMKHHRVTKGKFFNISKKYETYRLIGINSISKCRKGTMPVKDVLTNKIIGSVDVNHPKVISGEWVHHSKGNKLTEETKIKLKHIAITRNANSREYNFDYIKLKLIQFNDVINFYDNNFILSAFLKWFDGIDHKNNIIIEFKYSNNKINKQLISVCNNRLKQEIKKLAEQISIDNNFMWKFPKYGMGKYCNKDINI